MRHFSNWLDAYVQYTDDTEPPLLFRKWSAISGIAAVLQRKCWLEWEVPTYPNMYIVIVGPPATRKNTAIFPIEEMLDSLKIPLSASTGSKEALILTIKDGRQEFVLNGKLSSHCSLTVISKELSVFLGDKNIGLMSFMTDWFDCPRYWRNKTKNAGDDKLENVYINMLGATTPDSVVANFPQGAVGSGFTSRVIFVFEDKKGKDIALPANCKNTEIEKKLLEDLGHIHTLNGPFSYDSSFERMWTKFYEAMHNDEIFSPAALRNFAAYLDRRPKHILKLCMILRAAKDDSMQITTEDLEEAITLLKRTEIKMGYTFFGLGRGRDASVYAGMVRMLFEKKIVSIGELRKAFRSELSPPELDATIKSLYVGVGSVAKLCEGDKAKIQWIDGNKCV